MNVPSEVAWADIALSERPRVIVARGRGFPVCASITVPATPGRVVQRKAHADDMKHAKSRITKRMIERTRAESPNDPKLSDGGGWRGPCMVGGKAVAEARAVTAVAARCSAWLGDVTIPI